MKKLFLALFVLSAIITVTACKSNDNTTSNASSANWQVVSGVTENDLFDVNGNSSEYALTSSQFGELVQNQSEAISDNSDTSATANSSSKAQEVTNSINSGGSSADKGNTNTVSKNESNATSNVFGTDKDGDGWTDGWN